LNERGEEARGTKKKKKNYKLERHLWVKED
jgi:hypothetical protein